MPQVKYRSETQLIVLSAATSGNADLGGYYERLLLLADSIGDLAPSDVLTVKIDEEVDGTFKTLEDVNNAFNPDTESFEYIFDVGCARRIEINLSIARTVTFKVIGVGRLEI